MKDKTAVMPDSIKLFGITYQIKIISDNKLLNAGNNQDWGSVCYIEQIIYLNSDLRQDELWKCLFHELIHVIDKQIRVRNDEVFLSHMEVERIASGMLEILQQVKSY